MKFHPEKENKTESRPFCTLRRSIVFLMISIPAHFASAATPGLPFTEDFIDTSLRDAANTTANWDTAEQALTLNQRRPIYGAFASTTSGRDIGSDTGMSRSIAVGDMDGDGDLDVIAAFDTTGARLNLNNGTSDPFIRVARTEVNTDSATDVQIVINVALGVKSSTP